MSQSISCFSMLQKANRTLVKSLKTSVYMVLGATWDHLLPKTHIRIHKYEPLNYVGRNLTGLKRHTCVLCKQRGKSGLL